MYASNERAAPAPSFVIVIATAIARAGAIRAPLRRLPALCALLALWMPAGSRAQGADLCPAHSHTLVFFNGVWNTPDAAAASAAALLETLQQALAGAAHPDPGAVGAEVFYNASGLQRHVRGGIEDLVEVFAQRAAELDDDLRLRWELFWEVVDGRQDLWAGIGAALPRLKDWAATLAQARNARLAAWTAGLAARPPTEADYAAHALRLRALVLLGRGLLMVGHSQGNFFLNTTYLAVRDQTGAAALHIAPAAAQVHGPHLLSHNDSVIAALRELLPGAPPPANIRIPLAWADPTGHLLVETYLDADRNGRAAIAEHMLAQLRILRAAPARAAAGFFTVTLAWNGPGDLDLHVAEPGGAHVHYAARIGASGALDLDNTAGWGPEHYHAACDADRLQAGIYSVGLNHYAAAAGRTAMVQIASAERGVLRTFHLDAGPERGPAGDATPVPVAQIKVARMQGTWTVDVH